jgi:hypothetical protein
LLRKIVGGVEEVVSQRVSDLPPADSATAILSFDTTDYIGRHDELDTNLTRR